MDSKKITRGLPGTLLLLALVACADVAGLPTSADPKISGPALSTGAMVEACPAGMTPSLTDPATAGGRICRGSNVTISNVTFEGLAQRQELVSQTIAGIQFAGFQALIDQDGGTDGGLFANEPTPSTIGYWVCTGAGSNWGTGGTGGGDDEDDEEDEDDKCLADYERRMNFVRPVSKVTFLYTAAKNTRKGITTVIMEAYDAAGNRVDTDVQPYNVGNPAVPQGPNDPNDKGAFRKWSPIEVETSDNQIHYVIIRGSPNQVGLDNYASTAINYAPTAKATWPSGISEGGAPVTFSGAASFDPATATDNGTAPLTRDPIVSYLWNFGDSQTATGATVTHAYGASGTYNATLTVTDPNGVTHTLAQAVVVDNVAPVVDAGATLSVAVGQTFNVNATFTDPGTEAGWNYVIEWDDNTPDATGVTTTTTAPIQRSHSYPTPGSYSVKVKVIDGDNAVGEDVVTVLVANAAPQAVIAALPGGFQEGDAVPFDGGGSSDPEGGPLTYIWDFGDGGAAFIKDPTHTFTDNGTYIVKLTVKDPLELPHFVTRTIVVANVAPTATLKAPTTDVAEGTSFDLELDNAFDLSSVDRLALTYAYDCGAGTYVADNDPEVSCTIHNQGTFTVRGKISDPDGGFTEYSKVVTVTNVAPTLGMPANATITAGESFDLAATFTDPGKDGWSYTINWGNGTSTGTVGPNDPKQIAESHLYPTANTFTVQVTVNDGDGGTVTGTVVVTVLPDNAAPTASAGGSYNGLEGSPVTFNGSGSSDPDVGNTLTYLWDFGDGSSAGTGVAPTHTYADDGTYVVKLTVKDNQGVSSAVSSTTAKINNVAPVFNAISGLTTPTNTSWSRAVSFTDPGQDSWTATVNYGDGSPTVVLGPVTSGFAIGKAYATTGVKTVRVTINDGGETITTEFQVTVVLPAAPPLAGALANASVVPCVGSKGLIKLTGTASDANGDPLKYQWFNGSAAIPGATTLTPAALYLPVGTYTFHLDVTENRPGGATTRASVVVEVKDNTAPVLSLNASPGSLWPPNHKYHTITVNTSAVDICTVAVPTNLFVGWVESNEPDESPTGGDGKTTGDIKITHVHAGNQIELSSNSHRRVPFHKGDKLEVRAERLGNGSSRVYTIKMGVGDAGGSSEKTTTVRVEHDQGKN